MRLSLLGFLSTVLLGAPGAFAASTDTPLPPENVRLVVSDDFSSAVLSWDPVGEVGENGGYVDPSEVTYYVFDAFGSYYDPAIAETKKTSVTLTFPGLEGQDFVAYQVTAGCGDNYSLHTSSNIAIVGAPAPLPFSESFADGLYGWQWVLDPDTDYSGHEYGSVSDDYFAGLTGTGYHGALRSFDGDNGFFFWLPYEKDVMMGMMSLRADISEAVSPVLEFRYQGEGSILDVLVASGTGDLEAVRSIDLKESPTSDWTLCRIPLDDFKAAGTVNFEIRLTASHNDAAHTYGVPLDAIAVRDLVDVDLRLASASVSSSTVRPGESISFHARIHNQGVKEADTSLVLYIDGVPVARQPAGRMEADSFADVEVEYTVPLDASDSFDAVLSAVANGDGVDSNNDFHASVTVRHLPYPTISDLSGVFSDETVSLSWSAPALEGGEPVTITEDFENPEYTPMGISGAGGFTVYDGDGAKTINVFSETYNPYQTQPMAFQLFNRDVAHPYYSEDCDPHSGSSFMLAPTSYYADNDNWLVSPELSGRSQTVTFWAKSFSITWAESMQVLHSTGGNNPAVDFTSEPLLDLEAVDSGFFMSGGVPEVWTKYEVPLPEGTKFFAIRHYGWYSCALFIDDITYEGLPEIPADLTVEGYHVMRDGTLLTEEPVASTSFVDAVPASLSGAVCTYSVIPVYNYGTGRSLSVSVAIGDISAIGSIEEGGEEARYFTIDGREIRNPGPGTIVIRISGGKTSKIIMPRN